MHFLIAPDAISERSANYYYLDLVIFMNITIEVTGEGKNPFN